jgi:acylphosphatase
MNAALPAAAAAAPVGDNAALPTDDTAAASADDSGALPVPEAIRFRVTGRVQGVYFRASARQVGEGLGLRGWVRNRGDGAVDGHLQGDRATVEAMLDWCREGPPGAVVERLTCEPVPVDTNLAGFTIRP